MTTLFTAYIFFALVLIGLALPLINKRIGPNLFYGFRVPSTVKDKEKWYPVNAMMGKWLLASAFIFLVTALGLYFVPGINVDQYAMGSLASFVVPFAIGLILTFRYLRTLPR